MLVARRGELLDLEVTLREPPKVVSKLAKVKEPSEAQQKNFRLWLSPAAK